MTLYYAGLNNSDGFSNTNNLPFPMGQLKTVLSSDGEGSGTSLTATSTDTSRGPMVFLQYVPPDDFSRGGPEDLEKNRFITLEARSDTTGQSYSTSFSVERPPVVLIHGLWDSPESWQRFIDFMRIAGLNQRYSLKPARYDFAVTGAIVATEPDYPSHGAFRPPTASALGLDFNSPYVLAEIRQVITNYREQQIAIAQSDVVAHSMGGLITRTLENLPEYLSVDTFRKGYVHKLITIGTPHWGSPLADQLFLEANTRLRGTLSRGGNFSFENVNINGRWWVGGVGDLRYMQGGEPSAALQRLHLPNGHPVPTGMIAGQMQPSNLASLADPYLWRHFLGRLIRRNCAGDPLADNLTPSGWPTVFGGQPSDAIVPVISQTNGNMATEVVTGIVHSKGVIDLGFTGPDELSQDSEMYFKIMEFLNTPIRHSPFHLLP